MFKRQLASFIAFILLILTVIPAYGDSMQTNAFSTNQSLQNNVYSNILNQPPLTITNSTYALPNPNDTRTRKQKVIDTFGVTEAFIQEELNKGYPLTAVEQALQLLQTRTASSYEQLIKEVSPDIVNLSQQSSGEIQFHHEAAPLALLSDSTEASGLFVHRMVYEKLEAVQRRSVSDTVYRRSVSDTVYQMNESEQEMIQFTDYGMQATNSSSSYDSEFFATINARPDQAPFSITNLGESISTLSGGLTLAATDFTLPGRNGLSFSLRRTYNSGESTYYQKNLEFAPSGFYRMSFNNYRVVEQMNSSQAITEISRTFHRETKDFNNSNDYVSYWNWVAAHAGQKVAISGWQGPDVNGMYTRDSYDIPSNHGLTLDNEILNTYTFRDYAQPKHSALGVGWAWDIPEIEMVTINGYAAVSERFLKLEGASYKINQDQSLSTLTGYPWKNLTLTADTTVQVNGETSATRVANLTGIKYYFNNQGKLIQILDAYGNSIDFTYTDVAPYGKVLQSVTDAIGNTIQISYTPNQVLVQYGNKTITFTKQSVEYYYPSEPWRATVRELLVGITDPLHNQTLYDYAVRDAAFSLTSSSNLLVKNPYALLTAVTHSTGGKTLYEYEQNPTLRYTGNSSAEQVYRITARKDQIVYANNTSAFFQEKSFSYPSDMSGGMLNQNHSFSTVVSDGLTSTTFQYVRNFRGERQPHAYYLNRVIQRETLPNGTLERITEHVYDLEKGRDAPLQTTTKNKKTIQGVESFSEAVTQSWTYDDYGNILTFTDPKGQITRFEYDPGTHLLKSTRQPIDENKVLHNMLTRNSQGTVVEIVASGDQSRVTRFENIDAHGNIQTVRYQGVSRDTTIQVEYDTAHHQAFPTSRSTTVTDVNDVTSVITHHYAYDTATGLMTAYRDGNSQLTSYTYDKLGRITKLIHPSLDEVNIQYMDSANELHITDETQIVTRRKWNALGYLADEGIFNPIIQQYISGKVMNGYDAYGRLAWSEDAEGYRVTYHYDAWNRTIQVTDDLGILSQTNYDDLNRTYTAVDAEEVTIRTTLDIYGRPVLKEEYQNGAYQPLEALTYDYAGHILTKQDAEQNVTHYEYDVLGQLLSVTDPNHNKTNYSYDMLGQLTQVTYPDLTGVTRQYDQLGRLIKKTTGVTFSSNTKQSVPETEWMNWGLYAVNSSDPIAHRQDDWTVANGRLHFGNAKTFSDQTQSYQLLSPQTGEYRIMNSDNGYGTNQLSPWRSISPASQSFTFNLTNPDNPREELMLPSEVAFKSNQYYFYFPYNGKIYAYNKARTPYIETVHSTCTGYDENEDSYTNPCSTQVTKYPEQPYEWILEGYTKTFSLECHQPGDEDEDDYYWPCTTTSTATITDYWLGDSTLFIKYRFSVYCGSWSDGSSRYCTKDELVSHDAFTGQWLAQRSIPENEPNDPIRYVFGDRFYTVNSVQGVQYDRNLNPIATVSIASQLQARGLGWMSSSFFKGIHGEIYLYGGVSAATTQRKHLIKMDANLQIAWTTELTGKWTNRDGLWSTFFNQTYAKYVQLIIPLPTINKVLVRTYDDINSLEHRYAELVDMTTGVAVRDDSKYYDNMPAGHFDWEGNLINRVPVSSTCVDYDEYDNPYYYPCTYQATVFNGSKLADGTHTSNASFSQTMYFSEYFGDGFIVHPHYGIGNLYTLEGQYIGYKYGMKVRLTTGTPTSNALVYPIYSSGQFVSSHSKDNAEIGVTLRLRYTAFDQELAGLSFRMQDTQNRYALETDGHTLYVSKYTNGTRTVLRSRAFTLAADMDYQLKVVANGSRIQAYMNHTMVMDIQDNSFAAGAYGPFTSKSFVAFSDLYTGTVTLPATNGQSETYEYDSNSNVTKRVDRNGTAFHRTYTNRNALASEISPSETITFTYDKAGRRSEMNDGTGLTSYSYKPTTGQLETVTFPDGKTMQYVYRVTGSRSVMTDPFGQQTHYRYDSRNRLKEVGSEAQISDATYTYYANSFVDQVKLRNNAVISKSTYEGARLKTLAHTHSLGQPLQMYQYNYDANFNITQKVENGIQYDFTYDPLNRIESSTLFNEHYAYDLRGNRAFLSSDQPFELKEGSYQYDDRNRLKQVSAAGNTPIEYRYNGDGLLVERTENGQTTRYYYDGGHMVAEGIVSGGLVFHKASYLRGLQLVARVDNNGNKAYYVHNGHGDVTALVDPSGNLLNQYTYDIWGNPLTTVESVPNPFRYSGEYWDSSTGLQYLRARWYDPSMGRFMNEDTYEGDISNPLSLNLYTYVHNNPLKYVDPSGHCVGTDYVCNWINRAKAASVDKLTDLRDNSLKYIGYYYATLLGLAGPDIILEGVGGALAIGGGYAKSKSLLNIGAGSNPIKGAINIDIRAIEGVDVVADANKLPYETATVDDIIMQSPYGYKPLESDAARVLKDGGTLTIVGNTSNKYFSEVWDASKDTLKSFGFNLMHRGDASEALKTSFTTSGKEIDASTLKEIILKRVIGD